MTGRNARCLRAPLALAAAALSAATAVAQVEQPASEWISLRQHSSAVSRAAFAACDRDADDRLSLFELARAVEGMQDIRNREAFQFMDRNADGYIQWPEFDQRFRDQVASGRALRIKPQRPFEPPPEPQPPAPPPASAEVVAQLLRQFDGDGDGQLQLQELTTALAKAGLPPAAVAKIAALDVNTSGVLEAEELGALAALLPGNKPTSAPPAARLPAGYDRADTNRDGSLDQPELETALLALHPGLARWSQRILADADRSGNGALGPAEIASAEERAAGERPR